MPGALGKMKKAYDDICTDQNINNRQSDLMWDTCSNLFFSWQHFTE